MILDEHFSSIFPLFSFPFFSFFFFIFLFFLFFFFFFSFFFLFSLLKNKFSLWKHFWLIVADAEPASSRKKCVMNMKKEKQRDKYRVVLGTRNRRVCYFMTLCLSFFCLSDWFALSILHPN